MIRRVIAFGCVLLSLAATGAAAQPPAPASCSASDERIGEVLVAWAPVPGAFHYRIYRDGEQIAFVSPPATSFADATTPGVHEYCIRAFGDGGEGPACCDAGTMIPLSPPASCTASDDSKTEVTVAWSPVDGVTGYRVYQNGQLIGTVPHPTTVYVDVPPPGTRQYCVRSVQGTFVSDPVCDSGTMVGIESPAPCGATVDSPDHVEVTWTPVADATSYEVLRNQVTIAIVPHPTSSYLDVPAIGTHSYCVRARIGAVSGAECCATGRRVQGPPPPPSAPALCQTQQIGASTIRLTWSNVLFEDGYRVYRDDVQMATLGPDATLFDDANPGLEPHLYCVRAFRGALVSEPCCTEGVILPIPQPCSASDDDTMQVSFQWTDVPNETAYRVIRDGQILTEVPANTTSYVDLPPPGTHTYCVRAVRGDHVSAACCESGIMKPEPPSPAPSLARRLSWETCEPRIGATYFYGPGTYQLVASVVGLDQPIIGFDLEVDIGPELPDAWRFDDAGCQTGTQLSVRDDVGSKGCPPLRGTNPLLIAAFLYNETSKHGRLRVIDTFDTVAPDPSQRYLMCRWVFDHSFSTPEPTVPGVSCGGAYRGLEITLTGVGLLQSGDALPLGGPGESIVYFNSGAVGTEPTTLGRLKALYR